MAFSCKCRGYCPPDTVHGRGQTRRTYPQRRRGERHLGGEMWEPMVIAIMAGLLFSTVMTLGVLPVLYAALYRLRYWSLPKPLV